MNSIRYSKILHLAYAFAKSRGCMLMFAKSRYTASMRFLYAVHQNSVGFVIRGSSILDTYETMLEYLSSELIDYVKNEMCDCTWGDGTPGLKKHMSDIPRFETADELELQLVLAGHFDNSITGFYLDKVDAPEWGDEVFIVKSR